MLDQLLEAERLATTLNDQPRLARVAAFLTTAFVLDAKYARALESAERALAIAQTVGNLPLMAEMDFRLGQVYHAVADYGRAVAVPRRRVELGEGDLARGRFRSARSAWLGLCLAETGRFQEGAGARKQ